jgi:hypothetical protein
VGTWVTQLGSTFTLTASGSDEIVVSAADSQGNTFIDSVVAKMKDKGKKLKGKGPGKLKFELKMHKDRNPVTFDGKGKDQSGSEYNITPATKQ